MPTPISCRPLRAEPPDQVGQRLPAGAAPPDGAERQGRAGTIPAIARALEALRQKLLQVLHYHSEAWQATEDLRDIKSDLTCFDILTAEIRAKTALQRRLTNEKKQTPAWSLLKKRDLTQRINALSEELEDLRTEKNRILASFDLADDKDMADIRRWTKQQEAAIQTLNIQESRCQTELNTALEEYKTLCAHAANFAPQALWAECLQEWESLIAEARAELKTRLGADYSERRLEFAEQRLREMLLEEGRELVQYTRTLLLEAQKERKAQCRYKSQSNPQLSLDMKER